MGGKRVEFNLTVIGEIGSKQAEAKVKFSPAFSEEWMGSAAGMIAARILTVINQLGGEMTDVEKGDEEDED